MRIPPRWRKILADLWGNKIRSLLVVLSIAVGTFAVGIVTSAYIILSQDMQADYLSVNPHSAIIYSQLFGEDLVESLERIPGVGQVEGRSAINLRVETDTQKLLPINLVALPSVKDMQIDRIRGLNDELSLELGKHDVFLENTALSVLHVNVGDDIRVELRDGRMRTLHVSAIIHDVTAIPYMFSGQIQGYVSPDTIEWLGGSWDYNQVYLTVAQDKMSEAHVKEVAQEVADKIEKSNRVVYSTTVYQPGQHYASTFFDAMGILLGFLGVLAVFLASFLVMNTISALLAQHIRYIGIMKSVGGQGIQLVGMYLSLVLVYGVFALLLSLPLSSIISYRLSSMVADSLNFRLQEFRVPSVSVILQMFVALTIPVAASLYPVWNGTRVTVSKAISNYGLSQRDTTGSSSIDRLFSRIGFLSRPLLISLRNTMRRKGRLILTLVTLTLGGAIFISVFNLRSSLRTTVDEALGYLLADVNIDLARSYRLRQIESVVKGVPGVTRVEGWGGSNAQLMKPGEDISTDVIIVAPPAASTLIEPVITTGRWLSPEDENAVVIGNHLQLKRPDLQTGDEIVMKINDQETSWTIVGTYQLAGHLETPIVYVNFEYLEKIKDAVGQAASLRLLTEPHDSLTQKRVAEMIERILKRDGYQVSGIETGYDSGQRFTLTITMLVSMLLLMAVLIALVGGLGLMGMMSMNVMERTREFGVMRAIGAGDSHIMQMVIVEGIFVGGISWLFASLLAFPFTLMLEKALGAAIVNAPLPVVFSVDGYLMWLVGVLMISVLASVIPARNASRLTIREVLAYE